MNINILFIRLQLDLIIILLASILSAISSDNTIGQFMIGLTSGALTVVAVMDIIFILSGKSSDL